MEKEEINDYKNIVTSNEISKYNVDDIGEQNQEINDAKNLLTSNEISKCNLDDIGEKNQEINDAKNLLTSNEISKCNVDVIGEKDEKINDVKNIITSNEISKCNVDVIGEKNQKINDAKNIITSNEISKCNVDVIGEKDDEEDDDDDVDYIPSQKEELEADHEDRYTKSLEENEEQVKKSELDEKKIKEIDDLWEKMKAQQQHGLKSSHITITTEEKATNDESNIDNINKSTIENKSKEQKILPIKRKRTSNMGDIIKRHTTSKKESTLVKSKQLWQTYRAEENIGDDLDIQCKNSQLEKTSFLNQAKYNEWKRAQQYRIRDMFKKQNK